MGRRSSRGSRRACGTPPTGSVCTTTGFETSATCSGPLAWRAKCGTQETRFAHTFRVGKVRRGRPAGGATDEEGSGSERRWGLRKGVRRRRLRHRRLLGRPGARPPGEPRRDAQWLRLRNGPAAGVRSRTAGRRPAAAAGKPGLSRGATGRPDHGPSLQTFSARSAHGLPGTTSREHPGDRGLPSVN